MDVLSLLRLVVAHWRVTAPAALLTVIGLVGAFQFSSPTYEATGSVLLLSPPEPPDVTDRPESEPVPDVGQNPFTRYGDLSVVADVLARVMDSDAKRAEFESRGVTNYEVAANRLQRGPVVEVTGQGPNMAAATRSAELVLTEVDTVLSELQRAEGADPEYFINTAPLDPPSTATAMYGSTLRAAIAVLALGVLGTLGLAVLAEAVARRRPVRLSAAAAGPVTADAARPGTERGASNGTRKADWSLILPALRSARERQAQEPAQRERSHQESSIQEIAWEKPARSDSSKQEPAWQKTFEQERSGQLPADNGHRRPMTDGSP
jgi:hypothetical protein